MTFFFGQALSFQSSKTHQMTPKSFFSLNLNSDFVKVEIATIHIHNATYTLQREN
jgi:hypothetical protein